MNGERVTVLPRLDFSANGLPDGSVETIGAFLAGQDEPERYLIPALLPEGVIMLLHGEPRARKSLVAFELALSIATGTAAFGLTRFTGGVPTPVLYVMEEDPRGLTRTRLGALVGRRCVTPPNDTLKVIIRRGVNLDDPGCVASLIIQIKAHESKLLVLDAARRLSALTDEGPAKVRELVAVLRMIVTTTGVAIVIVHHDVKPPSNGQDQRRRSQRASGGDWFAACECPVHVEKIGARESLVFPEDYKFTGDPAPFTFTCHVEGELITHLIGLDTTTEDAERAGILGKVHEWVRLNGPATKTAMKRAGLGQWEAIEAAITTLMKTGKLDAGPARGRAATAISFRLLPT